MKETRIPLESFDLDAFYNQTIKFIQAKIGPNDPNFSIAYSEGVPRYLDFGTLLGVDVVAKLLTGKGFFFFPFAVFHNGLICCANGCSYELPEDYDEKTDFFGVSLPLGREETLGFFVHRDGRDLVVRSAFCEWCQWADSPCPVVAGWARIDIRDHPMTKFIYEFVKN